MITGIDLEAQGLTLPAPAANENEDEHSTPISDPDIGLPWPNPQAVGAWWNTNRACYLAGTRLLLGQPNRDKQHCLTVLNDGSQAERYAAALNLAQTDPKMPFIETRAMAWQQQTWHDQI